jgi:D-alanyl-lipoteichoic acid acyltransferase DltB (MBOAT superfamily)
LIGFVLLGYAGISLQRLGRPGLMAVGVVAVVFAYVWLKKYTFFPDGVFLQFPYFTLGLSYVFFRVLHLLIEAGESGGEQRVSFGAYLLYTLNLLTFVSGPIQRYEEFARDQFAAEPVPLDSRVIGLQIERIIRGFFKVNVVATLLVMVRVDALRQMMHPLSPSVNVEAALRLALVYPLFLYANFSGYIDIIMALARLMRIRLPENFDRPFAATSVLDFWNRWHITLSSWLKTYVYNPLLLAVMRRVSSPAAGPWVGVFCYFVTFFLIGLWHGRTSEFIVYGLLQGGGISMNKLWQLWLPRAMGRTSYRELARNTLYLAFGRGLNFVWFSFTLLWFWSDWKQIRAIFAALSAVDWLGVWLAGWLTATLALALWEWLRSRLVSITIFERPVLTSRYARVVYASTLGLLAFVMTALLNQAAPAIVYKAF